MPNRTIFLTLVITAALTSGCGTLHRNQHAAGSEPLASHGLGIASSVPECLTQLENGPHQNAVELDSARIRLVSWNVKKGSFPRWHEDFSALAADRDLVLVQEAVWHPDSSFNNHHWAFAPGYRNGKLLSGVMTYSNSKPMGHCNLTSWEPWLGTPKATNITVYGLSNTDQTVLVVNMHAINFTLGVADFRQQIEQLRPVMETHSGPIIFSGDFNTWRKKRAQILSAFAEDFDLKAVDFAEDHRKVVFGQALDHVYVRGLQIGLSEIQQLKSSDHNPILVEFSL